MLCLAYKAVDPPCLAADTHLRVPLAVPKERPRQAVLAIVPKDNIGQVVLRITGLGAV